MSTDSPTLLDESTTAWLATTGSQIFLMQLGFLAFEVGFVKKIWTPSIILKNIEDTFVGCLTFLCFSYTLAESPDSWYGLIAIPVNPFLIGTDSSVHVQIFSSMFFATTTDTIISGAVLERMKNKAYIIWCVLVILFNYSFVAHWVWHPDGWLNQLGFVDGAGALVVHGTGGMASLIAIWKLGPRTSSINKKNINGPLLPVKQPENPIIIAIGAFILWYGWFAFNIASPIAYNKGIGEAIGTTAIVTCISPICSCCSASILMSRGWVELSYGNLLSCLLAGLISITGCCHTTNIWESALIGFLASPVYFLISHIMRYKFRFDDPLGIIALHLFCGIYSCLMEGILANDVYGSAGLIYGGVNHFGIQILGVCVVTGFNFFLSWFLWSVIMQRIFFRNDVMRVGVFDTYLGTEMFKTGAGNYTFALDEIINSQSNIAHRILWQFHNYSDNRFASEQLDYLIVVKIFKKLCNKNIDSVNILESILNIISVYIADENSDKCVNISFGERSRLIKLRKNIQNRNLDNSAKVFINKYIILGPNENVFDGSYNEVWRLVMSNLFKNFMNSKSLFFKDKKKFKAKNIEIPFKLEDNWKLTWNEELIITNTNKIANLSAALLDINFNDKININMDQIDVVAHQHSQSLSKSKSKSLSQRIKGKMAKVIQLNELIPSSSHITVTIGSGNDVSNTNDVSDKVHIKSTLSAIID